MKYLTMFSLLLLSFVLYSQEHPYDLPDIVPPSPTVANLMQFEEVPVDHYTGQPDISIPLFSKSIHQDLALNIALKYNTQGVKIDNRSGWTGTGWSLFAGGSISRTIRGFADESQIESKLGVYHNDNFWNYENLTLDEKAVFNWRATMGNITYNYDTEMDLYQFSFLNFSGRFVVTREGPKLMSSSPNIKIKVNQDSTSGIIDSFIIIDEKGYKYYFDIIETSSIEPFNAHKPQKGAIYYSGQGESYGGRSVWHLSKITTSNNKELVSFIYQDSMESYINSSSTVTNRIISDLGSDYYSNTYNNAIMKPKVSVFYNTIHAVTKKITRINFLDGVTVDFIIGGQHPETNGQILRYLSIKSADCTENKRYSLSYEQTDRLWLTKVTGTPITGISSVHTLSYFEKENLAPFNGDSDMWGFNYKLPYSENTIKRGLLTHIKTPTKGIKEFLWEEHTYSYRGTHQLVEAEYVKNPNNTDPKLYSSGFVATSPFITTSPMALTTLNIDHAQRIKIQIFGVNNFQHEEDYIKVTLSKSNTPEGGIDISIGNAYDYLDIEIGTYNVFVQYMGYNIDPNFTEVSGNIKIDYRSKIDGPLSEFMLGGGVRIKEVLFNNNAEAATPEKRILYLYHASDNSKLSSGVADSHVLGNLENVNEETHSHSLFSSPSNNRFSFKGKSVTYRVTTKGTKTALTKGGYIGYGSVKVDEVDNGYTWYSYTTPKDYPSPANVFYYPFYPAPNLDYKRGLLKSQEVFDVNQRKLKEAINTKYNFPVNKIFTLKKGVYIGDCAEKQFYDSYSASLNGRPQKNIPQCSSGPITSCKEIYSGCGPSPALMFKRDINFGWAQLKESLTRDYYYDDFGVASVVETKTNYEYNTENYQPKKVTTTISRSGTIDTYVEDRYYAVGGYPTTDFTPLEQAMVTKMASLYKVNTPIYVQNYKNDTLISTVQYGYDEFLPNMVQPKRITSSKGLTPKESRLTYHHYDSYGNPLEVSREDGVHIVYIWGYDYTRPLAKIVNSTYVGMPGDVTTMINNIVALSDTEVTRAEEQTIREQFDLLRDHEFFEDAALISFTYDPLIGVTSQTDPRGYTMTYHYDDFNRLEFVKDAEGKLISENKYRYKNQH